MSRWKLIQKIDSSIFLKLLLMFVGISLMTVVIIYLVLGFFIRSPDRELEFRLHNRMNYVELLVKEIGDPPDTALAGRIARQYQFSISIDGENTHYKTSSSVPSMDEVERRSLRSYKVRDISTGMFWGSIYVTLNRGGYRYLFLFPYDPIDRMEPGLTSTLVVVALLLFLATYLFTRRMLRPLRHMRQAVREISEGHLDHKIAVEHRDELGDLARSLNQMSDRVREMIEAKEQLMLDVSHELRSPLTRIAVALEVGDSEEIIRKNVLEMDGMITELLESARLASSNGSLRRERFDLSRLISDVAAGYTNDLPGVRLLSLPESLALEADPARIRSVLKNVIENAVKYSPKDRKPVEISVQRPPGWLEVVVQDFGVGISEKERSLVFEPFYRVDKSRCKETGGYGLGLSLCKKIMLAHGGDLRLESTLHVGTRVSILFKSA